MTSTSLPRYWFPISFLVGVCNVSQVLLVEAMVASFLLPHSYSFHPPIGEDGQGKWVLSYIWSSPEGLIILLACIFGILLAMLFHRSSYRSIYLTAGFGFAGCYGGLGLSSFLPTQDHLPATGALAPIFVFPCYALFLWAVFNLHRRQFAEMLLRKEQETQQG